ncbi:MAG: cation:proton antiporter family protein [Candidatus Limnocylindrales bacterium]
MPELPALEVGALSEQLRFILDLGIAVTAALIGGAIAVRLRQPAVIGYLLAGMAIGPATPGFVGDVERIAVLAEVGVVLLLFALGVEFSIRGLREVQRVAIPGGTLQVLIMLASGTAVMAGLGFALQEAFVIGACLSLSSTLVVLKTLIDRGELDSLHGRAAIGWSIVQDIATIVFIVALPPIAGGDVVVPFLLALAKAAIFLAIAYFLGTRLLPRMFTAVARLGSGELFLLAVVGTALLTAFVSSAIFGLSLALGAFVAGVLVSESELSHQAAAEVTPFRDLFAVLFFVSVGMLVDPGAIVADAPLIALLVIIAVIGKGLLTAGLSRAFGLPRRSALLLGAAMAQVGEFSFILAEDALGLGLVGARAYNLILGTAIVTILVSAFGQRLVDRLVDRLEARVDDQDLDQIAAVHIHATSAVPAALSRTEAAIDPAEDIRRPTVVVLGGGRVGRVVIRAVRRRGFRCVVVDRDPARLEEVAALGAIPLYGDAASPAILKQAGLDRARVLVVAIGDPLTARLATERALRQNPRLTIAARARGLREIDALRRLGVGRITDPEAEVAFELARHALHRMGVSGAELTGVVSGLRRDVYGRDHD